MTRSFDSPWKDALDEYLAEAIRFFHPQLHERIDWSRGYETLDAELSEIVREAEIGPTVADRLFRVRTVDGEPLQILIHIEVQTQHDKDLARRMFVYYYRLIDKYNEHVESLVILGDEQPDWKPVVYEIEGIGVHLAFRFHAVKLWNWADRIDELIHGQNPIGTVIAAHLYSLKTHGRNLDRKDAKAQLIKILLDRGWAEESVRKMYRLIDWFLELPRDLQIELRLEIGQYEQEKKMPYVVSDERIAREEGYQTGVQEGILTGRQEGRQEGQLIGMMDGLHLCLKLKFGNSGSAWFEQLRSKPLTIAKLTAILKSVESVNSLDELTQSTDQIL